LGDRKGIQPIKYPDPTISRSLLLEAGLTSSDFGKIGRFNKTGK